MSDDEPPSFVSENPCHMLHMSPSYRLAEVDSFHHGRKLCIAILLLEPNSLPQNGHGKLRTSWAQCPGAPLQNSTQLTGSASNDAWTARLSRCSSADNKDSWNYISAAGLSLLVQSISGKLGCELAHRFSHHPQDNGTDQGFVCMLSCAKHQVCVASTAPAYPSCLLRRTDGEKRNAFAERTNLRVQLQCTEDPECNIWLYILILLIISETNAFVDVIRVPK